MLKLYRTQKKQQMPSMYILLILEKNVNNIADYNNYIIILQSIKTRFQSKCITNDDSQLAIDKLKIKSSSGPDGISNKLIVAILHTILTIYRTRLTKNARYDQITTIKILL